MTDVADILSSGSDYADADAKRRYADAVSNINEANPLTAQMKKSRKWEPDGEGNIRFNVKLQRGARVANVGDSLMLPRPSAPTRRQGRAGVIFSYTTYALGGQLATLTKNKKGAFINARADEKMDALDRVANDIERQYNNDGRGILAVVETISGAPTYGVHRPGGQTVPAGAPGTLYFQIGQDVTFINPATGLPRVGVFTITDVDLATSEITLSGTPTADAIGDYICIANNMDATGTDITSNYLNEGNGILAVCNTGDEFEDIDQTVAGNGLWGTAREDAAGARFTELMAQNMRSKAEIETGLTPDVDYTSYGVANLLMDDLKARQRDVENVTVKGGFDALKMFNRTVTPGRWAPYGAYFSLNLAEECVGWVDLGEDGWQSFDGQEDVPISGILRDASGGILRVPHQVMWKNRAAQRVTVNLQDNFAIRPVN